MARLGSGTALYKRKKSSVERPVKELKGFRKVSLKPGETAEIKFEIGRDALSYFDADKHAWVCEPGEFEALIGASRPTSAAR